MEIRRAAVIGAGVMGRQIALNTALHDCRAALTDASLEQLAGAQGWAASYLDGRVAKGRISREKAERTMALLQFCARLEEAAAEADLAIEAVVEQLPVKRQVFSELDRCCPPRAILATNSSTIVSSRLADVTRRPEKVANLHYFNPALVMKLVEVVAGPHTAPETVEALAAFAAATGKVPVRLRKEIPGFIANRLMHAVADEALFLFEGGYATFEDIDRAAELGLGYPMGPFRLMDLTGIDVAYHARMERSRESGRQEDQPSRSIVEKYERGEWGRKVGKGWYTYGEDA